MAPDGRVLDVFANGFRNPYDLDFDASGHLLTVDVDGTPLLGIYEFDGQRLRICNARPGKPRLKTFGANLLSGHTLIVWEPEKP